MHKTRLIVLPVVAMLFAAFLGATAQSVGIASLTPGVVNYYAGNTPTGCSGVVTPAPAAPYDGCPPADISISNLHASIFDNNGNYYIADGGNHRIRMISPSGTTSTIAGSSANAAAVAGATGAAIGDNGPATSAEIGQAAALAVDSYGNVYYADYTLSRVRVVYEGGATAAALIALENPGITAKVGFIYTIAGNGVYVATAGLTGSAYGAAVGDGGLATSASFGTSSNSNTGSSNGMNGLVVDTAGNLYVADGVNDVVRKVTASTGIITLYAGEYGVSGTPTNGTVATAGPIGVQRGLAINSAGDLFLVGGDILMINGPNTTATTPGLGFGYAPGTFHIIAGGGGSSGYAGPYNTLGTLARLSSPRQMTIDPAGDLYLNDNSYLRITKLDVNDIITLVAGYGPQVGTTFTAQKPPLGLGGPATSAQLGDPISAAINPVTGDLYVLDPTNNVVYDVSASSSILAFGSQPTYVASSSQVAILSNVSTGTLHLSGISFGSTTVFEQVPSGRTDCTSSTVLQPGQSCEIAVVFTPNSAAASTGTVTITDDSTGVPGTTQVISLTGTGTTTASKTTLTVSPTPASVGQAVVLTATVGPTSGTASVAPTGSVSFMNGTTSLGTGPVNSNGVATLSVSSLAAGTYTNLTAVYPGDSIYLTSTSAAATLTVASTAATTTALVASSQTITSGLTETLTATVTAASGVPTGTVTFYNGATALTPASTLSGGVATFTTTALATGANSITAVYAGNGTYTASTSTPVVVNVNANNVPVASLIPGVISTFVGTPGTSGSTGDSGAASAALLNGPTHAAFDSAGDLFVVDTGNNTIRKVAATSGAITASSTITLLSGAEGVAGAAVGNATTATRYQSPRGIAFDASGNLYVADSQNNAVRKITASSGTISSSSTVSSFAGAQTQVGSYTGAAFTAGYTGDGGAALSATLNDPRDVAVDGQGNVFIADYGNNVVRMVNGATTTATTPGFGYGYAAGIIHTVAGTGRVTSSQYPNGDGGLATWATFSQIGGIAVDGNGNLYVSDVGNGVVRKIAASTGIITTFAGTEGSSGYAGDGGLATAAKLSSPGGLSFDVAGDLYIADTGNSVVRQVTPTGTIMTIAGNGISGSTGDGGGSTTAEFYTPSQAVPDGRGNIYVVDPTANTVRQINGQSSALVFPEQPESAVSAVETILVSNPGGQPLSLSALAFSSSVFTQSASGTGNCTATTVLAAGTSCAIGVTASSAIAATNTGTLTVTDNSLNKAGSQQVANLSVQTVFVPSQSITFTTAGPVTYGVAPITLQATASSGLAVTYKLISGPATLSGNILTVTGAGAVVVQASQAGVPLVYYPAPNVTQTITVNPATLTVTANSFSQSTGIAIQALTYTITGFVNSDTQATATTGQPALSTTATTTSPSGNYPVVVTQGTLAATNYVFVFVNGAANLAGLPQFITFNALPAVNYGVAPIALSATSTSGLTVAFTVVSGPATVSGNVLTVNGAGSVVIQATQAGNYNVTTNPTGYGVAVPVKQTLVVNLAPLTVTVANSSRSYGAANPTFTSTVVGTVGADVLTVTYSTAATLTSAPGAYTVTPTVTGAKSASYQVTAVPGTLTVVQATPQVLVSDSASTILHGKAVTLTATVSSASAAAPSGTVTFFAGTTNLGTSPIVSGTATLVSASVPAGVQSIAAQYNGDTNYAQTTSTSITLNVQSNTTTVVTASTLNSNLGTAVTFTATVTPTVTSNAIPTGTVTFYLNGTTVLGTVALVGNAAAGSASAGLTISTLPLSPITVSGTTTTTTPDAVTAIYVGDALFLTSTSSPANEIVSQEFTLSVPTFGAPIETITITNGQSAQVQGLLTGNNGFNQPVAMTCTGMPTNGTCTFNSTSIVPTGSGVTFNILLNTAPQSVTVGRNGDRPMQPGFNGRGGISLASLAIGFGLVFLRRKRAVRWLSSLTLVLAVACSLTAMSLISGCGSGSVVKEGVTPGTSTITITGTSGSVSYSTTLTLIVQ